MASPLGRAKVAIEGARQRSPLLDHAVRTQAHYGRVNGSAQAGAVTYFAFLSFFPILALAFFVVGYVARVYPAARDNLEHAITQVLPGIVGNGSGELSMADIQGAAATAGIIGLVGVLYSGLGWLSGMRSALEVVFEMPRSEYPNFFVGKFRDLVSLATVGLTLVVSVAVTGLVVGYSGKIVDLIGLGSALSWVVDLLGLLVGLGATMLLFYALFSLLARPPTPRRALWQGALLGAVGFEVLKLASSYLLKATQHQQAFKAFGITLILLVWINYFSRVVMYAAAWAHISPLARAAQASSDPAAAARPADTAVPVPATTAVLATPERSRSPRLAFGAGMASGLALVAAVRRRRHR